MPPFSGEYPSTIDDKNRIIIPAPLRRAAGKEGQAGYYVTRGVDDCIVIQTAARFEATSAAAADQSIRQTAAGRMLERARFSRAQLTTCDRQGRFRLPVRLTEALGVRRDVVIAGVNDRIEVWDRERWQEVLREAERHLAQGAEKIYGGQGEA